MPEKIYVTYNYLPEDRARAQQMFLEAGMLDVVVDPALLHGFQKLAIPNEETISRLGLAARLQALQAPTVHRVLEPTARELSAARLLHMFVWIHHSHEGHPRNGVEYDDANACPGCGDGLRQISPLVISEKEIPKSGMVGSIDDDVIVHNHPFLGASHSPDVAVAVPIFHEQELLGFAAVTAHVAAHDLGAAAYAYVLILLVVAPVEPRRIGGVFIAATGANAARRHHHNLQSKPV